jgi:hypothetical protein
MPSQQVSPTSAALGALNYAERRYKNGYAAYVWVTTPAVRVPEIHPCK